MKHMATVTTVTILSIASGTSFAAVDTSGTWRGSILVTSVTDACKITGYPVVLFKGVP